MDDKLLQFHGQALDHLTVQNTFKVPLHKEIVKDLNLLHQISMQAGFELAPVSSWRDYGRQLKIWNEKASGKRPVLDDKGRKVDIKTLTKEELMYSIMRWSAIPGYSRHHWGTDIDVYDAEALKRHRGYKVKLVPEEVQNKGIFEKFHLWLDQMIEEDNSFNFFRPYEKDNNGVAPEKWHLSHAKIAEDYQDLCTIEHFEEFIKDSDIFLKEEVLKNADDVYARFIINTQPPPFETNPLFL